MAHTISFITAALDSRTAISKAMYSDPCLSVVHDRSIVTGIPSSCTDLRDKVQVDLNDLKAGNGRTTIPRTSLSDMSISGTIGKTQSSEQNPTMAL
jgi:hypothetical protein